MNAHAQRLHVNPPILDLGAGQIGTSSYHRLIPGLTEMSVTSVNLEPAAHPSLVADIEGRLPLDSEAFATCLAFNVFEHLYHVNGVLEEIHRVLEPGGCLYAGVPFLARVHADPNDYFRFTAQALEALLRDAGFSEAKIEACGGGAITAALAQVDFAFPRVIRRPSLKAAFRLDRAIAERSTGGYRNANDYPVGYMVYSRK